MDFENNYVLCNLQRKPSEHRLYALPQVVNQKYSYDYGECTLLDEDEPSELTKVTP